MDKKPQLAKAHKNLNEVKKKQRFVIVPGGGIFADSVRYASQLNNLREYDSHFLALKSTEIFGHMIKSFDKKIHITEKIDDFKEKNLWLPSKILKNVKFQEKLGIYI